MFDKTLQHMPAEFRKRYHEAVAQKDKAAQSMLVNALVCKSAKYASRISIKDADSFLSRAIMRNTTESRTNEEFGVARCEAVGRAGSASSLDEGVKRGEVFIDDEGYYILRRKKKQR